MSEAQEFHVDDAGERVSGLVDDARAAQIDVPIKRHGDDLYMRSAAGRALSFGIVFSSGEGWFVTVRFADRHSMSIVSPANAQALATSFVLDQEADKQAIGVAFLRYAAIAAAFHEQWIEAGRPEQHAPVIPDAAPKKNGRIVFAIQEGRYLPFDYDGPEPERPDYVPAEYSWLPGSVAAGRRPGWME